MTNKIINQQTLIMHLENKPVTLDNISALINYTEFYINDGRIYAIGNNEDKYIGVIHFETSGRIPCRNSLTDY